MRGCRALSDAEISKVLTSLTDLRDRAFLILGLKTGFRVSELLSIRVSDVYQYGAMLSHVTVARKAMKKKIQSRSVALHNDAAQAILELIRAYGLCAESFLFLSREGENMPISRVQAYRILKEAFRKNKMTGKLATHSLRKSFCKNIYEASGKDIIATQRAMQHVSLASTASYLDSIDTEIDNLILGIK